MNEYMHLSLHREREARFRAEADADRLARQVLRGRKLRRQRRASGQALDAATPIPAQRVPAERITHAASDHSSASAGQATADGAGGAAAYAPRAA